LSQGSYSIKLLSGSDYCTDSSIQTITIASHALHAAFSASPTLLCQNSDVVFTDSSIANMPSYLWNFGDGNTDTINSPSHTYFYTGVYNAYEVVTDFVPCRDTAYQTIYVDSQSKMSIDATDAIFCRGADVTFTGIYSAIGNTGIAWSMGNGDSIKNMNPVSFAYDIPGTYTVTATALYRVCPNVSANSAVTMLSSPVINLGPDTSICKGSDAYYLTDYINGGNKEATWLWNTGQTSPGISITWPGVYSVTVTIDGCTASSTVDISNDCYLDIPNVFSPNGDGIND
jgi:PKD repeat protein